MFLEHVIIMLIFVLLLTEDLSKEELKLLPFITPGGYLPKLCLLEQQVWLDA
jgi:hypothetical protein